ncbi:MAG: serine hydrolase [Mastigocoleus sp.]
MSESIDKFTPLSKRQPENRRSRSRRVKKVNSSSAISRGKKAPLPKGSSLVRPVSRTYRVVGTSPYTKGKYDDQRSPTNSPTVRNSETPRRRVNPSQGNTKLKRIRKPQQGKKITLSKRTRLKPGARVILYGLRLLIVGVGIGAIVGTALSLLDPATRINSSGSQAIVRESPQSGQNVNNFSVSPLILGQEITSLKAEITNLFVANPNLTPGIFVLDLDNGSYVDLNGSTIFPTASTIKIPILIAFFQDVDAGKISLEETLTMTQDTIAKGSGDMQFQSPGTKFSAIQVADKMMTISDNTATNMLIVRMGGIEALNRRFRSWGLVSTIIRNQLPDIQGTNTSSPVELGNLMVQIDKGKLVSLRSRDRILDIMGRNTRRHLLPVGLGEGATIFHKTGNIGKMIGDVGLVNLPSGKRYIISTMVVRPRNNSSAQKFINSVSRVVYAKLSKAPSTPNSNFPSTGTSAPSISTPQTGINPVNNSSNYYQSPLYVNPGSQYNNRVPQTTYQQPNYRQPGVNTQYYYPNQQR